MRYFTKLILVESKLANLIVNTSSTHPTAEDSRHIQTDTLFKEAEEDEESQAPKQKHRRLITNVVVRQSGAFNSVRETGMSKVQQLKFVEMLKRVIVGESRVLQP